MARPSIDKLELDDILDRVAGEQKWDEKQAQDALLWYRRFLILTRRNRGRPIFGISQKSDHLWHEHITFTRRYREDCERYFGRFVDHNPTTPEMRTKKEFKERLRRTKALYKQAFGKSPPDMSVPCY